MKSLIGMQDARHAVDRQSLPIALLLLNARRHKNIQRQQAIVKCHEHGQKITQNMINTITVDQEEAHVAVYVTAMPIMNQEEVEAESELMIDGEISTTKRLHWRMLSSHDQT